MNRWILVLSLALSVLAFAAPSTASAGPNNCLAWDRQFFQPASDRPRIDRLAPDEPFGQLLKAWKADNCMRLNHIQVVGTHNSYHIEPAPQLLALIRLFDPLAALSFEYSHRPLGQQLETLQVRQLELDVFADPNGGLFAVPIGGIPQVGGTEPLPLAGMLAPGLKVLHIQDIDYRTTCRAFLSCLEEIDDWSDANPRHLPILVMIEAKDDPLPLPPALPGIGPIPPAAVPVPFTAAHLDSIDAEIRSVFGADQLMTPDDVRGSHTSLEEAILQDGWPTLNELRGRVFFALDNDTPPKLTDYISGHPALSGRVMFTNSAPGTPEAAFVKLNDPITDFALIQELVAQGYIVRTRADADTVEARTNSTVRRDAALASGAQFVSTDYPEPDTTLVPPTAYFVDIAGPGRCNPVLSPPGCDSGALE
jgi:hypothetical protein